MAQARVFDGNRVAIEALIDGNGPLVAMVPSLGRPAEDFDDLAPWRGSRLLPEQREAIAGAVLAFIKRL